MRGRWWNSQTGFAGPTQAAGTVNRLLTSPAFLPGYWCLLTAVALITRPPVPLDETRYLAVAWEMWSRGDFLVPYLNGSPYAHKPPLLFWLMHLGWWLFGVNEWWPRLVAPLFAFTSVLLLKPLAARFWPDSTQARVLAPLILSAGLVWIGFSTLTMFDMLIACFALIGIRGLWDAALPGERRGFWAYGLAVGFGLLAKGPIIFLHLLPPALLAPWWAGQELRSNWRRWYVSVVAWTIAGGAIALAWALPAALAGGPEYAEAIFWRQTAGRMLESFAHPRPWWWYLPFLPLALFPWSAWPAFWRAVPAAGWHGPGTRLCLSWLAPAILGLALISGKQIHYLVPLLPPVALYASRGLCLHGFPDTSRQTVIPGFLLLLAGTAIALPGVIPGALFTGIPPGGSAALSGGLVIAIGALLIASRPSTVRGTVEALTLAMAAFFVAVHVGVIRDAADIWRVDTVAKLIAEAQARGRPVAHQWRYHGEYQFAGRLRQPLEVLLPGTEADWLARHPDGVIVGNHREVCTAGYRRAPAHSGVLRGKVVDVWNGTAVHEDPSLVVQPCRAPATAARPARPALDQP